MRKINVYTKGYKEILKTKKYDFMEPAESFIRIYKTHIKNNKLLNSLDFGCGDGRHTKFLLKENHKVLATDISSAAIELTKKNIAYWPFISLINFSFFNIHNFKIVSTSESSCLPLKIYFFKISL